jgi:hypothetical protein
MFIDFKIHEALSTHAHQKGVLVSFPHFMQAISGVDSWLKS